MADINFLNIFHNNNLDKEVLIKMTNEVIELYGFPCVLKRWNGIQPALDPMYQDSPVNYENDESLYTKINTHVYIDYNRFNSVLHAYGLAIEGETTVNGMMKLEDEPKEDDVIELKLPYDEKLYKFKIGSTDVHKDICYSVVLDIHYQEG